MGISGAPKLMPNLRTQARDYTLRLVARGVREGKSGAPVITGKLRDSIRARRRGLRSWRIQAHTDYAIYVFRHRRNMRTVARRLSRAIDRTNFRERRLSRLERLIAGRAQPETRRVPARELVSAEYAESGRRGPAIDVSYRSEEEDDEIPEEAPVLQGSCAMELHCGLSTVEHQIEESNHP